MDPIEAADTSARSAAEGAGVWFAVVGWGDYPCSQFLVRDRHDLPLPALGAWAFLNLCFFTYKWSQEDI